LFRKAEDSLLSLLLSVSLFLFPRSLQVQEYSGSQQLLKHVDGNADQRSMALPPEPPDDDNTTEIPGQTDLEPWLLPMPWFTTKDMATYDGWLRLVAEQLSEDLRLAGLSARQPDGDMYFDAGEMTPGDWTYARAKWAESQLARVLPLLKAPSLDPRDEITLHTILSSLAVLLGPSMDTKVRPSVPFFLSMDVMSALMEAEPIRTVGDLGDIRLPDRSVTAFWGNIELDDYSLLPEHEQLLEEYGDYERLPGGGISAVTFIADEHYRPLCDHIGLHLYTPLSVGVVRSVHWVDLEALPTDCPSLAPDIFAVLALIAYGDSRPAPIIKVPADRQRKSLRALSKSKEFKQNVGAGGLVPGLRIVDIQLGGAEESDSGSNAPSGTRMSTHLRRGHFRNVPYGPMDASERKRKLVFIPPTLVNQNLADGESKSPVYRFRAR